MRRTVRDGAWSPPLRSSSSPSRRSGRLGARRAAPARPAIRRAPTGGLVDLVPRRRAVLDRLGELVDRLHQHRPHRKLQQPAFGRRQPQRLAQPCEPGLSSADGAGAFATALRARTERCERRPGLAVDPAQPELELVGVDLAGLGHADERGVLEQPRGQHPARPPDARHHRRRTPSSAGRGRPAHGGADARRAAQPVPTDGGAARRPDQAVPDRGRARRVRAGADPGRAGGAPGRDPRPRGVRRRRPGRPAALAGHQGPGGLAGAGPAPPRAGRRGACRRGACRRGRARDAGRAAPARRRADALAPAGGAEVGSAVRVRLCGTGGPAARARQVVPYGILFGRAYYLVGPELGKRDPVLWRLDRLSNLALEDRPRSRRTASASPPSRRVRSEPSRKRRRMSCSASRLRPPPRPPLPVPSDATPGGARGWNARGALPGRWAARARHHLFTWGDAVEIVSPERLRAVMVRALDASRSAHSRAQDEGAAAPRSRSSRKISIRLRM